MNSELSIDGLHQRAFKIILVGMQSVGKSSILYRLIESKFNQSYQSTVGIDFKSYPVSLGNKVYTLQIWDTAGQQKFRALTGSYYKGSHGCLCVFDLNNEQTLGKCDYYIDKALEEGINKQCIFLIGNKLDLGQGCSQNGSKFAEKYGINYRTASAMTGENIQDLFVDLTMNLVTVQGGNEESGTSKRLIDITDQKDKKCRC